MPYTDSPFAHRINKDGTVDSICKKCFRTIGTAEEAAPLEVFEDAHVCDPKTLEVVKIVAPH